MCARVVNTLPESEKERCMCINTKEGRKEKKRFYFFFRKKYRRDESTRRFGKGSYIEYFEFTLSTYNFARQSGDCICILRSPIFRNKAVPLGANVYKMKTFLYRRLAIYRTAIGRNYMDNGCIIDDNDDDRTGI